MVAGAADGLKEGYFFRVCGLARFPRQQGRDYSLRAALPPPLLVAVVPSISAFILSDQK